ncbi:MAG: hypothetical protein LC105_04760 [Chitinophagales bacterium]|nr:hypothetical protein [Chitinophagales bacterium]MCZ2393149.1 hypothetical protein [Chitinophagales bacterium]
MKKILSILFSTAILYVSAQQLQIPLEQDYQNRLERYLSDPDVKFHTSVKPYLESEVLASIPRDEWKSLGITSYNEYFSPYKDSIGKTLLQQGKDGFTFGIKRGDFLQFQKEKIYIGINPIVDFSVGYDLKEKSALLGSQYGAQLNSNFGKKVSMSFTYRGLTENTYEYIDRLAEDKGVTPGFGKVKWDGSTINAHDFNGYISIKPAKFIHLQAGYGKNFWGDGYRSLFISDYASSYPYFAFHANFWRIKYSYLFNFMKDGSLANENNNFHFQKKYGVFHMLSADIAKWFEFSFFEGVVWSHGDSTGTRGIELNYLNPVVFFRPVEFAVGSPDNITLGLNMKFKVSKKTNIYTQILLDDLDVKFARKGKGFYRNKFAFQLGLKSFDLFKIPMFDLQLEANAVRPYVFAHKIPAQNYTHNNLSLTHPLGANFVEFLAILRYEKNSFYGVAKLQYARQGRDLPGEHKGSNIYRSDYDIAPNLDLAFNNSFLQGVKTDLLSAELRAGYLLNPKIKLSAEAIFHLRKLSSEIQNERNIFVGIGIKSNLFNRYRDF